MRFLIFLLALVTGLQAASAAPARWTITDEDTTLLVFGSIHVLKPGMDWLDSGLRADLLRADSLYLEVLEDPAAQGVVAAFVRENGVLRDQSLQTRLGPKQFPGVRDAFQSLGVSPIQYQSMRPWLATVTLVFGRFQQLGYRRDLGVEATLQRLAGEGNIPVQGLEGPLDGLSLFAGLRMEAENKLLVQTAEDMENAEALISDLSSAWVQGDVKTVARITNQSIEEQPDLMEPLLYGRNQAWAKRLETVMAEPGLSVVVVGTAHLVGDGSLLDLMAQQGYQVRRIPEPATVP